MRCPVCNAEIPADSAFCPKCGQSVSAGAPGSSVAASSVAASSAATPAERLRSAPPAGGAPPEPEQELWRGGYSAKAMYGTWFLGILVSAAALVAGVFVTHPLTWIVALAAIFVLWVVLILTYLVRRMSIEYILTNQRLMHMRGLLRRVSNRIVVIDIDDVTFEQGPFDRLFGVGKIRLKSTDLSDPELSMSGIDNVQQVANLIDNARREERRKRAVFMETV